MIDKVVSSITEALADVRDGASIMIGGFGGSGIPHALIKGLVERGVKDLTLICNSYGVVASMPEGARVKKLITAFPIAPYTGVVANPFEKGILSREIAVEVVPLGTLVERIRAGGAGIGAFYTPTGVGTLIDRGKEKKRINGREYVLEQGLRADFSFIKAHKSDRKGNLVYRKAMRNHNPVMATAGRVTIAEVEEIVEELEPETIVTPGIFVDRVVKAAPVVVGFRRPPREAGGRRAEKATGTTRGLTRELMAMRVARGLRDGMYVNLGLGLPTYVSSFVPAEREVVFQSENGILGLGPIAEPEEWDPDLINAGSQPVTLSPGASFFDISLSFAMITGGHLDLTVLGAYQVSERGDLANWNIPAQQVGGIGGAMDLASGAKQMWVMMEHTTPTGEPRILKNCTYPLTGRQIVNMIYTDLAVIEVSPQGLVLQEVAPGVSPEEVQAVTEPRLIVSTHLKVIEA